MLRIIVLIVISIFLIFLDKKVIKNKDVLFPTFFILFLIILMGGQLYNPDYNIYNNIFLQGFYKKDPGFGFIIVFLKFLGFNQNNFRIGIAILGFILLFYTVFKNTNNRSLFCLLYFLYPFFFDIVQLRNFLVMSIIVLAISFLKERNIKNNIIFILLILVASTIQKIAIIYLPLIFVNDLSVKSNKKVFFSIIILISIVFGLNRNLLLVIINNILLPLSSSIIGLKNYTTINTNMGWIVFWLEQIFSFIIVNYIYKSLKKKDVDESNSKVKLLKVVKDVNFFMFIFLPLFIIDENYVRIIRNIIPLNLLSLCIYFDYNRNFISISLDKVKKFVIVFMYQFILFILFYRTYADLIFYPTFNKNWIIQLLFK